MTTLQKLYTAKNNLQKSLGKSPSITLFFLGAMGIPQSKNEKTTIHPFSSPQKNTAFVQVIYEILERMTQADKESYTQLSEVLSKEFSRIVIPTQTLHKLVDYYKEHGFDKKREQAIYIDQALELTEAIQLYEKTRDSVIRENMNLVHFYAKDYYGRPDHRDIVQEGMSGLIVAIDRFDFNMGNQLSTIATFYIKDAIRRWVQERGLITITTHARRTLSSLNNTMKELTLTLGRAPTVEEVATAANMDHLKVAELLQVTSKSEDFDTSNYEPEQQVERKEHDLSDVLSVLQDRERKIVELRYGFDCEAMTLEQVHVVIGVTRERVRQIEARALEKIRELKLGSRIEILKDL